MKSFVFSGRPRLGALCSLILASQLAACGGDDGGSRSTPPPSGGGNPPPVVPAKVKLTLKGTVTDEPIANAAVTATVGSQTFTATADASGNYSLNIEIDEAQVNQFITLLAKGVGDQEFVEFTSLAGSFSALVAQAGADGTLSSDENFVTQITNVSTAAAVLLQQANGGQPVISDELLAKLSATINAQDVLDIAAVIKLAVDNKANYPLPAGQTSILALVSDPDARQQFINAAVAADPAAFAAAQSAIAQDSGLSQPVKVEDLDGAITTALLSSEPDFSFNTTGRVMHFDLNDDGTGSVISETFDQPTTWVVEGTTLRVTYNSPVETVSYDTENCVGDGGVRQVEAHYVSNGATIAFLNKTTVAITTKSNVTYADCASLAPREDVSTVARTVLSMDNAEIIDAAELPGVRTLYVYDSAQQTVVADIANIAADGTGTTQFTNLSFTWQLDETGKVVQVEFTDGSTAEYLSLGVIPGTDELATDLFWEVRTPGNGPVYTGAGASVYADPEYAVDLTAEDVPGRFYQFGIGNEAGGDSRLKGFRLRFDADFTGAHEDDYIDEAGNLVTVDETVRSYDAFRWALDGGNVVVRRTWDDVIQTDNCLFGANANCELYDERRIIPIAASGTRVYWLEERRFDFDGVTANTPATRLVRFYDYEPLSGTAPNGSSKVRAVAKENKARTLLRGPNLR